MNIVIKTCNGNILYGKIEIPSYMETPISIIEFLNTNTLISVKDVSIGRSGSIIPEVIINPKHIVYLYEE